MPLTNEQILTTIASIKAQLDALAIAVAGTVAQPQPEAPSTTPTAQAGNILTLKSSSGKENVTTGTAKVTVGMMVKFANGRSTPVMATDDGITFTTREPAADSEAALKKLEGSNLTVVSVTGEQAAPTPVPTHAPDPVEETKPTPPPTPTPGLRKKGRVGINLGMGAGADQFIPGRMGTNYNLPTEAEIQRAAGYGFLIQRWGMLLGRIFKDNGTTNVWRGVDAADKTRKYTLDTLIDRLRYASTLGVKVLIDNHAYGFFPSNGASNKVLIGSASYTEAQFAAQWLYVANEIKKDSAAWSAVYGFDITNEPYDAKHDAASLVKIYQAVIDAMAPMSEDKVFVLEGPGFSSTRNWVANWKGMFSKINHPRGKLYIEPSGHLYLDPGADGYYDEGDTLSAADVKAGVTFKTIGTSRAKEFKAWAKAEGYNANFGENLVTGTLPGLMQGEEELIAENVGDGTDTYLFGMGDWFGNNPHNIELSINKPMLELAKKYAAKGNG